MRYQRKLPHWHPEDHPLFITWRFFGTLPWHRKAMVLTKEPDGKSFVRCDRELERSDGPRFMTNPEIADCIADRIVYGESGRGFYQLHAWVVMPNHVHIVITPQVEVTVITRWLKGSAARAANKLLNRSGAFWQDESWDRWLRNGDEIRKCIRYVEFNPVAAGLVASPELWHWSSASWQAEAPAPHCLHV
jgi:putative DNA methylase